MSPAVRELFSPVEVSTNSPAASVRVTCGSATEIPNGSIDTGWAEPPAGVVASAIAFGVMATMRASVFAFTFVDLLVAGMETT